MVSLEKLEPSLAELENPEKRNQWCDKVLAIRSSIEAMTAKEVFARKSDDAGGYDESERELLQQCWYSITITLIFTGCWSDLALGVGLIWPWVLV